MALTSGPTSTALPDAYECRSRWERAKQHATLQCDLRRVGAAQDQVGAVRSVDAEGSRPQKRANWVKGARRRRPWKSSEGATLRPSPRSAAASTGRKSCLAVLAKLGSSSLASLRSCLAFQASSLRTSVHEGPEDPVWIPARCSAPRTRHRPWTMCFCCSSRRSSSSKRRTRGLCLTRCEFRAHVNLRSLS